ncbi:MAG: hypothetical protein KDA45_04515, partial [Planctomycetales bacterium]|nr:hypothetical protein [Planctomycetales bacterium]
MSSIPNPLAQPQRPPGRPSPPPPRRTTDEVRQSLHVHLRKTATFIKFLDALVLLFAWWAGMLAIWLLACVIDHWLWPLPGWGRWAFWSLGVAGTLWWLGWQLSPLLLRRINPIYAAQRIEHVVPEFKNGLISWLELESLPQHGVPRGVIAALTYRAARFLGGQEPSSTVDTTPLIKLVGGVLLLLSGLAVYTMLSPKSVLVTGKRIALPWSSTAPPSRVQILQVLPGSIELTQGKPLAVEVEVKGLRRQEAVAVRFSTLDGQFKNRRSELIANTEGFRYVGDVRTAAEGIDQPLDYWIEAGDATSGPYRVTLSPLPSVVLKSVELQFPAYTGLAPRAVNGGKVEAVEGSRLRLKAEANQAMSRGRLEINPQVDAAGELVRADAFVEMAVNDRQLQAEWLLQLDAQRTNPTAVEYRIRGYNQRGDVNPRPITHQVSVQADLPPEVTLVGPESRIVRVRPQSRINLEVRASDPDYGLTKLSLAVSRNNISGRDIPLLNSQDEGQALRGRQVKTYSVDLARWHATVGDRYQLRAIAEDNRHEPLTGEPAPNTAESEALVLLVVGPDESPDVPDAPPPANDAASDPAKGTADNTAVGQPGNPATEGGSSEPRTAPDDSAQSAPQADPKEPAAGQQASGAGGDRSSPSSDPGQSG